MTAHLVVGAGPVGTAIARRLATQGHDVILASRSGRGPTLPGVTRTAVDAADPTALTAPARGAAVIYNALNPSAYHRWAAEWPPMAAAVLAAAEASGAALVTVSNLYGYGRVTAPMREDTPLRPVEEKGRVRVRMWQDALAAHRAGRVRALEVRASDYLGAGVVSSATLAMAAVVAGRRARILGRADVPHSWTYAGDVAALAIAAGADETAYGRAWHVPTNPPRTQLELLTEIARRAGAPAPRVAETPDAVLRLVGLINKPAGAAAAVSYQFAAPFVIDDTAARARFGLRPTAWDDVLGETATDLLRAAGTTRGEAR
jgi:nucleoside-diphosphate-sugar epimerase